MDLAVMTMEADPPALPTSRVRGSTLDSTSLRMLAAWHAVATSDELGEAPYQVQLLGQRRLLVRLAEGRRASRDKCPHGDLAIPALCRTEGISRRATLPSPWGVLERYGLVWLAPLEPRADRLSLAWRTLVSEMPEPAPMAT